MFLAPYFTRNEQSWQFSRQQASHFAKYIAGDFNPIHDEEAKRFCVPGDLLFSMVLANHGLHKKMKFTFSGMVTEKQHLHISESTPGQLDLVDEAGKAYLHVNYEGELTQNSELIEQVTRKYVRFSGMNFPHIMVPLMESAQSMINPDRPLVIYESMEIEFDTLEFSLPDVELTQSDIEVDGKRGSVTLGFRFSENGKEIGHGRKVMRMSGLKPYCANAVDDLVNEFNSRKASFLESVA
ncbi:DUF3581 family protein [Thaumasiovibrio subtropicus]|uniref:DUF3581 family protein n=1 Tax=Thaumasiovibrio subtropicus TaxID=1891207 RepID=UPI000B35EE39|nr:DUF3581 family protein [Thaumasiovibrio subtropicus]